MALTLSELDRFVVGDRKLVIVDVTFDSSYPAGGEAITKDDLNLDVEISTILPFIARDPDTVDNFLVGDFDHTNSKLVLGWDNESGANSAFTEVDDTTNVAAYTATLHVFGK